MPLRAPRFVDDDILEKCANGELHISQSTGISRSAVGKIQLALNSSIAQINGKPLAPPLNIDGIFGVKTAGAVKQFRLDRAVVPTDLPEVDSAMLAQLDALFAHELIDRKAFEFNKAFPNDHPFYVGSRSTNQRIDHEQGLATCEFTNGLIVEVAHARVIFVPKLVAGAWQAAGFYKGQYGYPASDPQFIKSKIYVQEFGGAAYLVDMNQSPANTYAMTADAWRASTSGRSFLGLPTGAEEPLPSGMQGTRTRHENGWVIKVADRSAQPMPDNVYALWSPKQKEFGAPTAFPRLSNDDANVVFAFENGRQIPETGEGAIT